MVDSFSTVYSLHRYAASYGPLTVTVQPASLCVIIQDTAYCYRCSVVCLSVCLSLSVGRDCVSVNKKGKGSPYSITARRVPEPIPVLGSQPAGGVSHKPDGRLPLLSARPVTPATLKRAATNFSAW